MSAGKDLARHRITGASLEVRLASYRIYGFLVALLFFCSAAVYNAVPSCKFG